jgi:hypothetical protein
MPKRLTLHLSDAQRAYLIGLRDRDPRPYLRERAAALLKIADGMSPHAVALQGLLKRRDPDTVYTWLRDYMREGILRPRPACRGRFSPSGPRARDDAGSALPPSR